MVGFVDLSTTLSSITQSTYMVFVCFWFWDPCLIDRLFKEKTASFFDSKCYGYMRKIDIHHEFFLLECTFFVSLFT